VHGLHRQPRRVLLVLLRLADRGGDRVDLAELVTPNVGQRDVDIVRAREVARAPEEPVALRQDVEDARARRRGLQLLDAVLFVANAALVSGPAALLARRPAPPVSLATPVDRRRAGGPLPALSAGPAAAVVATRLAAIAVVPAFVGVADEFAGRIIGGGCGLGHGAARLLAVVRRGAFAVRGGGDDRIDQ